MSDPTGNWPKWIKTAANWIDKNIVKPIVSFAKKSLSITYNVPMYNQGDTNLCWAYSQAMIEDSKAGIVRTQEQANERVREIAINKHGTENWDRPSRPDNINKISSSSISIGISLKLHGPLYATYGQYDQNGNRISGHAVVITGIDFTTNRIYTNNPWGMSGIQSYNEFLSIFEGADVNVGWKLDGCYYLN